MSWSLIKSIQKDTDMRLILPFGLNLRLGDVISVSRKDGAFNLEGSSASILHVPLNGIRPPQSSGVNLFQQSGKSVSVQFRAQGTVSSLFPDLPHANAGFDVAFNSANSWLLAFVNRQIWALDELDRFRGAILQAHRWGVWKPDWVLVTSLAVVDRITLIASSAQSTNVAVSLGAKLDTAAPLEVQLTAGASIAAANQAFVKLILSEPSSAFCSGLRVRDHCWSDPAVSTLERLLDERDPIGSPTDEFWEDAGSFD